MSPTDYESMKRRLRELLDEWGVWTESELDKVARFVEMEVSRAHLATEAERSWTMLPARQAPQKVYSSIGRESEIQAILTSDSDEPMSSLLHHLWTKAVGTATYVKAEWQILEGVLYHMRRALKDSK